LVVFDRRDTWALRLLPFSLPAKSVWRKPQRSIGFWVLTEHDIATRLASR
jgi:hypothetical protein